MSGGDDDDYRLLVIISPPAHIIIVTEEDGSFVPHWCNRRCWTRSDPSSNYTLRIQEELVMREALGSMLNNRGSPVLSAVRHQATVVVLRQTRVENPWKCMRCTPGALRQKKKS